MHTDETPNSYPSIHPSYYARACGHAAAKDLFILMTISSHDQRMSGVYSIMNFHVGLNDNLGTLTELKIKHRLSSIHLNRVKKRSATWPITPLNCSI